MKSKVTIPICRICNKEIKPHEHRESINEFDYHTTCIEAEKEHNDELRKMSL